MKTGKISTLILAFALCFVVILLLRVSLIPELEVKGKSLRVLPTLSQTTRLPDFDAYSDVADKKSAFFEFLRPIVQDINQATLKKRRFVSEILLKLDSGKALSNKELQRLSSLGVEYGLLDAEQIPENSAAQSRQLAHGLLKRIDIVPESLVLVQAANESGWGSSRFAREGLNLFGQWCYTKGCGMVPSARAQDMNHEVTVFNTVEDAIASYINNLNTHSAYKLFRAIRAEQRAKGIEPAADALVYGLINYSERREAYVDELLQMLRHNKAYLESQDESDNQTLSAVQSDAVGTGVSQYRLSGVQRIS
ncbi:glucosaminidase domain-containing protein [Shewanella litorisediminis]|uniref:Glucosaminidase domain-containing protein n=1 Tax=Shewanella litorisediminis TaxID=1173586 RepID=A0ABX7G859_9GAMM|nr:glucosaminidase domain-containing protein [Shewanella litorisediminis]MCL2919326.1 glucosaminidase domain-containing protein [Shewanella litorisediminis]QRH03505.1 glucosaminidase domain-containing protein [Shewanella litorisediminis]